MNSESEKHLPVFILKKGRDYVAWASQMQSWFFENNLWQYIIEYAEGVEEPDYATSTRTDIKKYLDWQVHNSKAKNMMAKCIDINYKIIIQDITTAK